MSQVLVGDQARFACKTKGEFKCKFKRKFKKKEKGKKKGKGKAEKGEGTG